MAPPALVSLENYSDVQFRDVVHRRSMLVVPTLGANVIQKLYHHANTATGAVTLSSAELVTSDTGGNAQYSLMLGTQAKPLDANTFTSANAASWTANAMVTANSSHFTVRSANLTASTILCDTLSLKNDVKFANVRTSNLTVDGNIIIDTDTLTVDPNANKVGILTTTPQYALDVNGVINASELRSTSTMVINNNRLYVNGSLGASKVVGINNVNPQYPLDVTGDINTTGALRLDGTIAFDGGAAGTGGGRYMRTHCMTTANIIRTISTTVVGQGRTVCSFKDDGEGLVVDIVMAQGVDANNAISKAYTVPFSNAYRFTGTKRLLPISSGPAPLNDLGLDVKWDNVNDRLDFNVVRTKVDATTIATSTSNPISFTITIRHSPSWGSTANASYADAAYTSALTQASITNADFYWATRLSQIGTGVVINAEDPISGYSLDVNGAVNCRTTLESNLSIANGMYLSTSGTNKGLMFGNTWRIWYNPTTQNLEIQQNTNNDINWNAANVVTTAILAAK